MARPANMVAAWFKKFFVKFYAALDATQRKRATEIIRRYSYLIPKLGENSVEQKKALPSDDASYESRRVWRDSMGVNAAPQRHKHCKGF